MNVSICLSLAILFAGFSQQIAASYAEKDSETYEILLYSMPIAAALIGVCWAVPRGTCNAISI